MQRVVFRKRKQILKIESNIGLYLWALCCGYSFVLELLTGLVMEEWMPKSEQIDRIKIGEVTLTLASWQSQPFLSPSFEIGWRCGKKFELIQFRMRKTKAWGIVQKLVYKGKCPKRIIEIISWLER